ncbi:aldose epimerase family protein [Neobacillus endophyticus]|uniref:aldose epimerase family protein n=1 Tax=Neobacillus endophyticus TaxID=2738405 RepID=UPI0028A83376|nr:aldose epimerase [Neobacillus endophyticus]
MYQLNIVKYHPYDVYELIDKEAGSWLKVVPERGGIIIGYGVKDEEILFLNEDTLLNPEKNIRGGIPILFPISGQLENGQYEWKGHTYKMKNHGVARNHPWEVIDTTASETEASITICLTSNLETKKEFPFDFELVFTYRLTKETLIIEQLYKNLDAAVMPMYPGFHPYFKTSVKNLTYKSDAKTYLDYNDMAEKDIHGSLDLTDKKESFALLDAEKKEISFDLPDRNKLISMNYGKEFKYVVLWTEKSQEFICVEPWMALTNELNRKEELVMVEPGETLATSLHISVK